MLKTGILGGTFDPPHNAHIMMAVAAIEEAGLDRVILMPNGDPPHKKARVSASCRLKMTRLAAEEILKLLNKAGKAAAGDVNGFINENEDIGKANDCGCGKNEPAAGKKTEILVSDLEIIKTGPSFLADSIEEISRLYPEDELYFIAGGDAISSMASWYKAERIFEKASILAFKRKGPLNLNIEPAVRYLERRGAKVVLVDCELPDISSTEIRRLITDGRPYEKYLPETVSRYIKENKLYS